MASIRACSQACCLTSRVNADARGRAAMCVGWPARAGYRARLGWHELPRVPMIQAAAFVRRLPRITLWLFVALCRARFSGLRPNRLLDESPDPSREGFLVSSQDLIPNERNLRSASGLTAPRASISWQYGSRVKALYARNAPQGEIQEMVAGTETLRTNRDSDQVTCWLDPGDPHIQGVKKLLTV